MATGKTWEYTIAVPSYNKGTGYVTLYFQEDYDVAGNYSILKITGARVNHSSYKGRYYVNATIKADGVLIGQMAGNQYSGRITSTGSSVAVEGTFPVTTGNRIAHNADGSKTVIIAVTIDSLFSNDAGWVVDNVSGTQSVALTTIPRASGVSGAGGDIGAEQNLIISRASSSFTHTLKYSFGSASGTIITKTADTSVVWTPPLSLCSQIPNAAAGICTITCDTYSGDTLVGTKTSDITLSVPASVGLAVSEGWVTVQPYNTGTKAEGISAYVQGYSRAEAVFDEGKISDADAYGARIASFAVSLGGVSSGAPYRTAVLQNAGEVEVVCSVTDTRGHTVSQSIFVSVCPYANPTMSEISVFRCNSYGVETDEGTFISVTAKANYSSIDGLNSYQMLATIAGFDSVAVQSGVTKVIGDGLVLTTATYTVQVTLTDALGNRNSYTVIIPTAEVMFHARQGGKGAAFGKYAEEDDLLEVSWNQRIKKNLTVEQDATVSGTLRAAQLNIGGKTLAAIIAESLDPLADKPVGYIYISLSATSPASIFGGTWEQLKDRFLIGAGGSYAVNATGGEAKHTLTANEMPSHRHSANELGVGGSYCSTSAQANCAMRSAARSNMYGETSYTAYTGGGAAHNNLPPYLAVYMWKRVA